MSGPDTDMTVPLMTQQPCLIHNRHRPTSHINHRHHVWPLASGGPTTADNIVVVCPTGHSNIHHLLQLLERGNGVLAAAQLRRFSAEECRLAALGWERMRRGRM